MSERNSSQEQRESFGRALAQAIVAAGIDHGPLGSQITGASEASARKSVYYWIIGKSEPSRPQVLMLEELLGLTPGALSCHLGWVPAGAGGSSLDVAITLDPSLTDAQRQALLQILRTFRSN